MCEEGAGGANTGTSYVEEDRGTLCVYMCIYMVRGSARPEETKPALGSKGEGSESGSDSDGDEENSGQVLVDGLYRVA